jgi:hypothetical protein
MHKKNSWKQVAYFFVGWRTFYCASEKFFANRLVAKNVHGQRDPQTPWKRRSSCSAGRDYAVQFATTSANRYPGKMRKTT